MKDYEITDYGGEKALIVRRWSAACEQVLRDQQLLVVLNTARGWSGGSVSFLSGLELERVEILANTPVEGLRAVEKIRGLKKLSLSCESKTDIDFTMLTDLTSCWLWWSNHYCSVFNVRSLKTLGLAEYNGADLAKIASLPKLEELRLKSGNLKSLGGLFNCCGSLKSLELTSLNKLTDYSEIKLMKRLEILRIDKCKNIEDINFVSELKNLNSLEISDIGNVASLAPVENIKRLRKLVFSESTNIVDGDLSFLSSLPVLKDVVFQGRKHYTHMSIMGRLVRKPWK